MNLFQIEHEITEVIDLSTTSEVQNRLVQRIKQRLNLNNGSRESKVTYRHLRATVKLVCGEYIDFKKTLGYQDPKILSRAVQQAVDRIRIISYNELYFKYKLFIEN